uniref:Uncharacterized protein n=1 Tax=Amphiprion percula TaxID=161767 RepID=A0A3P8T5X8_AMPPE
LSICASRRRAFVCLLGGLPPSTAVSVNLITACFSRSKAFSSTNSADALCSPLLCTSREKYSFGLNMTIV